MNSISCKIFREERLFDNVFTAEVQLKGNPLPHEVGVLSNIQLRDGIQLIQIPAYYLKIFADEDLYRIFFTSAGEPFLEKENPLFTPWSLANKVVLFIDKESFIEGLTIMHYLRHSNVEFCLYIDLEQQAKGKSAYLQKNFPDRFKILSSFTEQEIFPIIQKHTVGTKLFIAGQWRMIEQINRLAIEAGFSDEEIQVRGTGKQNENIFCVKCYQINNSNDINEQEPACEYCHSPLDISRHYSKRLNAYLGYVKL